MSYLVRKHGWRGHQILLYVAGGERLQLIRKKNRLARKSHQPVFL